MSLVTISERDFQRQITDLAEILGWKWAHFRPAQTSKGWRTPVAGPLGAGWPDLVLARGRRLIFAELKRDGANPTETQRSVLATLAKLSPDEDSCDCGLVKGVDTYHRNDCAYTRTTGVEVYVWRPASFDNITTVLR